VIGCTREECGEKIIQAKIHKVEELAHIHLGESRWVSGERPKRDSMSLDAV